MKGEEEMGEDVQWNPHIRVKLVKTLNADSMPIGMTGTVLKGTMDDPGMLLVEWDYGATIPMYCNELERI